jgi:mannose-6-phosphate isomerase
MPYQITGKVQHYAWGGYEFIPRFLHRSNPARQPFAEYWLGAHEKAPSEVSVDGQDKLLDKCIQADPDKYLGAATFRAFGRLPFLFKVLDVRDMLSIQVHPDKLEAEKGFARENAAGIPLDSPERNYKDDNHKPEMMVALSDFYLLHGFREPRSLRDELNKVKEMSFLCDLFDQKDYKGLYSHVMQMAAGQVKGVLTPLLTRLLPLYRAGKLSKESPDFWAARAVDSGMTTLDAPDRGIFSIYFFNLLHVRAGEGTFQGAGVPHAYLEGQNVELMANSDNVLRGGLTPKHVDVAELLKHIRFQGEAPGVLQGRSEGNGIFSYDSPVKDFALSKIEISEGNSIDYQSDSASIMLTISGGATASSAPGLRLERGSSVLLLPGEKMTLAAGEDTVIYTASVPVNRL